jgi:hypothetical protein
MSFMIVIFRRLNAHSTTFYTLNLAYDNFSAETIPVNSKTQSFKFRRNLCYFIPYCDISAFKRSFHSILHAERSARQFQRRNNPCISQEAIFEISTKTLCVVHDCDISSFKRAFHSIVHVEHSARQFQRRNNPCKSQNAIIQISSKTLLIRS